MSPLVSQSCGKCQCFWSLLTDFLQNRQHRLLQRRRTIFAPSTGVKNSQRPSYPHFKQIMYTYNFTENFELGESVNKLQSSTAIDQKSVCMKKFYLWVCLVHILSLSYFPFWSFIRAWIPRSLKKLRFIFFLLINDPKSRFLVSLV